MGCGALLCEVWHQNTKIIVLVSVFVLVELILLVPDYGSFFPGALGALFAIILAATILNRYFWVRIFRPLLRLCGAEAVDQESGECCCCCFCRKHDTARVNALRAFFVVLYSSIYIMAIAALITEQTISTLNDKDPHPFVYFSFQWAGGVVLMLVSAWFVDMFLLVARTLSVCGLEWMARRRGSGSTGGARRGWRATKPPSWVFPPLWAVTFSVLVAVSHVQGTREPVTRVVEVPLKSLPECLDGYTLAMVSDIHAGPTVGKAEIERHVEAVNALGADAIVVVGDLVDDQVADIGPIVEPVSGLSAPDGQYFVLGNHEHYTGEPEAWATFVAQRGFTVLNDTRVTLPPGAYSQPDGSDCYFYLAGVDDWEADPDYVSALSGRDESVATVLLAHEPKQVVEASEWSVGLHLAGHTHGGQVFPYHVLAYLDQGYVSGLHKRRDTFIYVSEGAVGWGPRMRLLSTTEYTLVVLRTPELFSDPDTGTTESTRASGAAGVLLILTFVYCLGYPVLKAFRRARETLSQRQVCQADGVWWNHRD